MESAENSIIETSTEAPNDGFPELPDRPVEAPHENGEIIKGQTQERIIWDNEDGTEWHKEVVSG